MAEKGRIEVQTDTVFLGEINPFLKVPGLNLIAVHPGIFLIKNGVAGVHIDLLGSGGQL